MLRFFLTFLVCFLLLAYGAWGGLALFFRAAGGEGVRLALAAGFALVVLLAIWGLVSRRLARVAPALLLCPVVFVWWGGISASNSRDWAFDVARPPMVRMEGSRVVVENVRDFAWTGEAAANPAWETRAYDLDGLISVDLYASHWSGETIAHTFVSFGFADGRYLAWSAELRRSVGQTYKTLESLFKLSELILIAGDERDLVGVRAKHRDEDVRLFPLRIPREAMRELFLSYAREANELAAQPRWYNTLTNNCTTTIFELARMLDRSAHYDWRILLPGHFAEYAYEHGAFGADTSFEELKRRSHISERARSAPMDSSVAFSQAIRAGLR